MTRILATMPPPDRLVYRCLLGYTVAMGVAAVLMGSDAAFALASTR